MEAASVSHSATVDAAKLPHASTGFVGRDDRPDVRKLGARSGSSAVLIDDITPEEYMSLLDPECPQIVRSLVSGRGYRYIVNDIK